jgi:hypothetical protein
MQAGERRGLRESYKESFTTATKYQKVKTKQHTASRHGHFSSAEEIAQNHELDRWVGPSGRCLEETNFASADGVPTETDIKVIFIFPILLFWYFVSIVGRDSSVGIATRYRLDRPGIESRWGVRFSAPGQNGPGALPASYAMGIGSFPGVKRLGRGVDDPTTASADVKGRVELIR